MMQKNESEQNRRKMRRGDKEAILKGLKGGLCDNYYGICCAVKYNMKDDDIIAALKELQKDTYGWLWSHNRWKRTKEEWLRRQQEETK